MLTGPVFLGYTLKNLWQPLQSGPVSLADTVLPVLGDLYCSPLARFVLATTRFQLLGLLARFLRHHGVLLELLVESPLHTDRRVRAAVASMHSPLGPASSLARPLHADLEKQEAQSPAKVD